MREPAIMTDIKIGAAKGTPRSRLWLEGKLLAVAGFKAGDKFTISVHDDLIGLDRTASKSTLPQGTVSGTPDRPIIDLTGKRVRFVFPHHDRAIVRFFPNRIEFSKD